MSDKNIAKDATLLAEKVLFDSIEYDKTAERLANLIGQEADALGFHGNARDGFVLDIANYVRGLQKGFVSR